MDKIGQKLLCLYPDKYGLMPTDHETYIALSVRDYLAVMNQEERKKVLRNLIKPKVVQMDGTVLDAAVDREVLGMLVEYATHESLKALGEGMAEDTVAPGVDVEAAVGLKMLAASAVRKSYEAFRPEDMNEKLESFLRAVWETVCS